MVVATLYKRNSHLEFSEAKGDSGVKLGLSICFLVYGYNIHSKCVRDLS